MNDYQNRIEGVLNLPLHQYFGIKSIEATDGRSVVTLEVGPSIINPAGMLHGGVIYALCDVAAYTALLSILAVEQEAVTHDIHVSVLRPVDEGKKIRIEAQVIKRGKSIAFIDSKATVEGIIFATARITKTII